MNRTKILCISALLFFVALSAMSQSYTIIHVKGNMQLSDGTPLKRGTKLADDAKIVFGSPTSAAAAISSSRGRFVIKQGGNASGQGDAFYLLKAVLTPVKGRMSTRSGELNNLLVLKKFFSEEPLAFLGGKEYVKVSEQAFPQGYQRFFFIRYQYKGETINKKLLSDKQTMIWDQEEIYQVDGEKIDPSEVSDYQLFYLGEGGEPQFISKVDFSFVPMKELEILVEIIKVEEPDSQEAQIAMLTSMISELYGRPQDEAVAKLFQAKKN
ncbi:MAG: hypothetical protein AAFO69_20970 [Bacteroidota bacterium]